MYMHVTASLVLLRKKIKAANLVVEIPGHAFNQHDYYVQNLLSNVSILYFWFFFCFNFFYLFISINYRISRIGLKEA